MSVISFTNVHQHVHSPAPAGAKYQRRMVRRCWCTGVDCKMISSSTTTFCVNISMLLSPGAAVVNMKKIFVNCSIGFGFDLVALLRFLKGSKGLIVGWFCEKDGNFVTTSSTHISHWKLEFWFKKNYISRISLISNFAKLKFFTEM